MNTAPTSSGEVDEGAVSMVSEMGFTPAQARKALKETVSRSTVIKSESDDEPFSICRAAQLSELSNGFSLIQMTRAKRLHLPHPLFQPSLRAMGRPLCLRTMSSEHLYRTRDPQCIPVIMWHTSKSQTWDGSCSMTKRCVGYKASGVFQSGSYTVLP